MSGSPIKDKTSKLCFLDTCIYINYGVHFEVFHDDCVRMFESSYCRYTSESVNSEIAKFRFFMNKFGLDLAKGLHQSRRKDLMKFPYSVLSGYSKSQMDFIQAFLGLVKSRTDEDILSEYRTAKKKVNDNVDKGLDKTVSPFIMASTDQRFLDQLAFIGDDDDKQIIADAVFWSLNQGKAIFCTADSTHILHNKPLIIANIMSHYGKNTLDFSHVQDL